MTNSELKMLAEKTIWQQIDGFCVRDQEILLRNIRRALADNMANSRYAKTRFAVAADYASRCACCSYAILCINLILDQQ